MDCEVVSALGPSLTLAGYDDSNPPGGLSAVENRRQDEYKSEQAMMERFPRLISGTKQNRNGNRSFNWRRGRKPRVVFKAGAYCIRDDWDNTSESEDAADCAVLIRPSGADQRRGQRPRGGGGGGPVSGVMGHGATMAGGTSACGDLAATMPAGDGRGGLTARRLPLEGGVHGSGKKSYAQ